MTVRFLQQNGRTVEEFSNGIESISVFIDDICVSGETDGVHLSKSIKLSLNQEYLHLPERESEQKLLIINTPKGLLKFTRKPYGIENSKMVENYGTNFRWY